MFTFNRFAGAASQPGPGDLLTPGNVTMDMVVDPTTGESISRLEHFRRYGNYGGSTGASSSQSTAPGLMQPATPYRNPGAAPGGGYVGANKGTPGGGKIGQFPVMSRGQPFRPMAGGAGFQTRGFGDPGSSRSFYGGRT